MSSTRVPDLYVERLARGDVPPEGAAALRERLQAEPGGLDRLARIQESDREILVLHPPATVAAEVGRRLGQRRWRPVVWAAVPVLAAAVGLVMVLQPEIPVEPDGTTLGQDRPKGPEPMPEIRVYRDDGAAGQRLEPGGTAHTADLLQLAYVAGGEPYGVIVSVDGRGEVTQHFPLPGGSTALLASGESALPFSYELDDAPAFARFFLVTSDEPVDPSIVMDATRKLAADGHGRDGVLPLPSKITQTSVLLRKETP